VCRDAVEVYCMARKVSQIVRRGDRTWLVRVYNGRGMEVSGYKRPRGLNDLAISSVRWILKGVRIRYPSEELLAAFGCNNAKRHALPCKRASCGVI
jgi:hypothetical protein